MPLYEVEHICPLSEEQQDRLAEAITRIHSEKFTTPKLFVNVRIQNIADHVTYVGGKRKKSNKIEAIVRAGGGRKIEHFNEVCAEICEAWADIVGTKGDQELRAIFVLGSMITGAEVGISIPQAGDDAKWLKAHIPEFKRRAAEGDGDFIDLMDELQSREAFKGVLDGQVNGTH